MEFTPPLARLIECFQRFPGVGPKSAQRMAFQVLQQPKAQAHQFADALVHAVETIKACEICYNWSAQSPCELCCSQNRNTQSICVLADVQDLMALERTSEYRGQYHVLQGLISPMSGVGPEDLTIRQLLDRLHPRPDHPPVEEVILALPPSIEGDTTSLYLSKLLASTSIKVTRIGFGLPVGGELEYADSLTITRALAARQLVS